MGYVTCDLECLRDTSQEPASIDTNMPFSFVTIWVMQSYERWMTLKYYTEGAQTNIGEDTNGGTALCGHAWIYYQTTEKGGKAPDPADVYAVYNDGEPDQVISQQADATGVVGSGYWIIGCWFTYEDFWGEVNIWSDILHGVRPEQCGQYFDDVDSV